MPQWGLSRLVIQNRLYLVDFTHWSGPNLPRVSWSALLCQGKKAPPTQGGGGGISPNTCQNGRFQAFWQSLWPCTPLGGGSDLSGIVQVSGQWAGQVAERTHYFEVHIQFAVVSAMRTAPALWPGLSHFPCEGVTCNGRHSCGWCWLEDVTDVGLRRVVWAELGA